MKIKKIRGKNLPQKIFYWINKKRIEEYGSKVNLFDKKPHKDSIFFFVKDDDKIVSFGFLRKVTINYLGKKYKVKGIGGILSVEKGKGYGKILIQEIIKYLKKSGKTGLGFCGNDKIKFYEKAGLNTKKNLNKRFVMKNPKTGELIRDPDKCSGIYSEGKDKLIEGILKTKSIGYYWLPDIKEPHW